MYIYTYIHMIVAVRIHVIMYQSLIRSNFIVQWFLYLIDTNYHQ